MHKFYEDTPSTNSFLMGVGFMSHPVYNPFCGVFAALSDDVVRRDRGAAVCSDNGVPQQRLGCDQSNL